MLETTTFKRRYPLSSLVLRPPFADAIGKFYYIYYQVQIQASSDSKPFIPHQMWRMPPSAKASLGFHTATGESN